MSAVAEHALSEDLAEATLGALAEYITSGSRDWSKYYAESGAIFIRTQDINRNKLSLDDVAYVHLPDRVEGKRSLVRKGDLLITITGANVGKVAVVETEIAEAYVSQSVCLVRLKDPSLAKFVQLQLIARKGDKSALEAMAYGLGRPVLNLENIRSAPIKVGPKQHQEAVVAEIEKQFSRLDEAVANLKRVKANLTRYKAAVLKAAVEGRLVPTEAELARREGRSYETGAQLVQRILETRRSLWKGKGKYKEPAAPDPAGLRELPEGWIWSSLDQVAWDSSYGTSVKCSYDREGPPVLRIPNIEDGSVDLADLKFGPPTLQIGAMDAVAAGDMLVIRTNGSKSLIGRAAVVAAAPTVPTAYASYLIRFRLLRLAGLPAWISTVWGSSQVRSWIESRAATSAGQHNISMRVLAAAPVPVAPIGEQRRIVAEVQRRMSLGGQLERGLAANVIRSDHLRNAALSAFFSRSWSEVAEVGR